MKPQRKKQINVHPLQIFNKKTHTKLQNNVKNSIYIDFDQINKLHQHKSKHIFKRNKHNNNNKHALFSIADIANFLNFTNLVAIYLGLIQMMPNMKTWW